MVAPVTGPFNSSTSTNLYYDLQRKYKQAKPVDRPLQYYREGSRVISNTGPAFPSASNGFGGTPNTFGGYTDLFNKSYAKLRDKISDNASWGANLAEYNQSISMMTNRVKQIHAFTRSVRKLDFEGAARALGLRSKPSRVSPSRSVASNWLEYSFGWKPLLSDIHSSIDFLQTPIKTLNPKGSASDTWFINSNPTGYPKKVGSGTKKVSQGCKVTISNPNLWLANSLGLVNPLTIAWEVIPFSFVIDWFVNVEQFLSSGTDLLGLTVSNPWRQASFKGDVIDFSFGGGQLSTCRCATYYHQRELALSGVTLIVRPPRLWGWQRAANAAAVLTLQLKRI